MQGQILKVLDVTNSNKKVTNYISYPEKVLQLIDTSKGVLFEYTGSGHAIVIPDTTARLLKRSIQEQLQDDHKIGFLKLESNYHGHKGLQYINVAHIASIAEINSDRCEVRYEYHNHTVKIDAPAFDVAFQVRRVIKRLDQDQELCCEPVAAEESDTE